MLYWSGVIWGLSPGQTVSYKPKRPTEGAKYKSFETREEAEKAFESSPYEYIKRSSPGAPAQKKDVNAPLPSSVVENSLAVETAAVVVIRELWDISRCTRSHAMENPGILFLRWKPHRCVCVAGSAGPI